MRSITRTVLMSLVAAGGVLCVAGATNAAPPLPAAAFASKHNAALIDVRHRRHRSFKDDYYDDGGIYDIPPPPPARIYRVPPFAPPVVGYRRPLPYPPLTVYRPPVYGWQVAPWGLPPRPASCGKYRYWDGEGCADARYHPPYLGPRW